MERRQFQERRDYKAYIRLGPHPDLTGCESDLANSGLFSLLS